MPEMNPEGKQVQFGDRRVAHTCRRLAGMRSWHPAVPGHRRILAELPRGRIHYKTMRHRPLGERVWSFYISGGAFPAPDPQQ